MVSAGSCHSRGNDWNLMPLNFLRPEIQAMSNYRLLPAGDTAIVVEFGDRIDRALSARVLALARRLEALQLEGLSECVPTFRSLMVHYDPLVLPRTTLCERIRTLINGLRASEKAGRHWRLPVCYDRQFAPDLDDVSARTDLSPSEIIECHSGAIYHVYMLGFLPGLAYMGDVPAELALPRRPTPRLKIPAGSLAIANMMTCVFPMETPCGLHVIGRSPVPLWQRTPMPGAFLSPGDTVTFVPISVREYEDLSEKVAAGLFAITPWEEPVGAVA
jgi:KipI family sensor histidine kinase inhibitor